MSFRIAQSIGTDPKKFDQQSWGDWLVSVQTSMELNQENKPKQTTQLKSKK